MIRIREIQFISYIIMFWLILYGQVNSLDCRRHVFAPGCRGIVAKRTHNLNNVKFETQKSKTITSDGSQSLPSPSSSLTASLLSPLNDDDMNEQDQPELIQFKRYNLPVVLMLNRGDNRLKTSNSEYKNNIINNPLAWLFSLTTGSNNNNDNSVALTSVQHERQSTDSYD